jgi:hypothetical protein
MKANRLDTIIDNFLFEEVKKTILNENEDKKEVYHITCEGEPVMICSSKDEAAEHVDKLKKDHPGKQFIIEKGDYESHDDMIDKLDEMGEELEKNENKDMKNTDMNEKLVGNQSRIDANKNGKIDAEDFKMLRGKKNEVEEEEECHECGNDMKEDENYISSLNELGYNEEEESDMKQECNECGGMMNEEGMCNECGSMMSEYNNGKECNECGSTALMEGECLDCGHMHESIKKGQKLRITESELVKLISKMVTEAKNKTLKTISVPGLTVTKMAQKLSDKENKENIKNVETKIKKRESFNGTDNPEFPKSIGKGEKKAVNNTKEEDEYVADNRGYGLQHLKYENEPSQLFKDRLKKSLEGHTTMGNSQEAANVVKSNLGKEITKNSERKMKKEKEAPMYKKDPQPVKIVKESTIKFSNILEEEIKKMNKISSYNKKTQ